MHRAVGTLRNRASFVRDQVGGALVCMAVPQGDWASLVRDQADGALVCMAVPQGDWASLVRDQADGALSSAAVLRCGLWPLPPPLCRCAERTADRILQAWRVFSRCVPALLYMGHTTGGERFKVTLACPLSLWERVRVRATSYPLWMRLAGVPTLTPALSQREREQAHVTMNHLATGMQPLHAHQVPGRTRTMLPLRRNVQTH